MPISPDQTGVSPTPDEVAQVTCPKCGGEDFREFGSTNYSQNLTLKRDGEKIIVDSDDECGGYGERIDYPDGDEVEGVECVACQQEIEVEGVSPIQPMSPTDMLRQIHRYLHPELYSSAGVYLWDADTIETVDKMIAEAIKDQPQPA